MSASCSALRASIPSLILASVGALTPGVLALADLLALPTALVGVGAGSLLVIGVFCPLIRVSRPAPTGDNRYCFGPETALGSL